MKDTKAYTLVEICIIMVILGVLAAVLIPQFGQAATEARTAALCGSLDDVRADIELYRQDHKGQLPGAGSASWIEAMLGVTDIAGSVYTDAMRERGLAKFGPYMRNVPVNPFNDCSTVRVDGPEAGANTHGWRFDSRSGEFQADDNGLTRDGTAHTEF
jgi:general secretion pathway protein G